MLHGCDVELLLQKQHLIYMQFLRVAQNVFVVQQRTDVSL